MQTRGSTVLLVPPTITGESVAIGEGKLLSVAVAEVMSVVVAAAEGTTTDVTVGVAKEEPAVVEAGTGTSVGDGCISVAVSVVVSSSD